MPPRKKQLQCWFNKAVFQAFSILLSSQTGDAAPWRNEAFVVLDYCTGQVTKNKSEVGDVTFFSESIEGRAIVPKSYLNSEPYGIGELIARKKHLRVPSHQRDYAWGTDEVARLLEDLFLAVESESDEYFLGLLVIVGPVDGSWMVLDGQQRLATCTMVLAAVRFWLTQLAREDDATQIQRQFISVRRLGGDEEPRLIMNHTNRDTFALLMRPNVDSDEIRRLKDEHLAATSNYKLIDAYLSCRTAVGDALQKCPEGERDAFLYRLADFLENQAQTVCLEVDQAADAYKIFESLNDRGMALSALDLFKNFAFGTVAQEKHSDLSRMWEEMSSQIVDSDAEDFLKIVWTARFGRVQRGALFSLIRKEFSTERDVLDLIQTLSRQAELYTALLEPSHYVWAEFGEESAGLVATLRDLRSRQVRPIVLAALSNRISSGRMAGLLKNLVSLTVRYQTIGKKRTGLLEIACAKAARELTTEPNAVNECLRHLRALMPSDEEFRTDFQRYRERDSKRALHVLLGIESICQNDKYDAQWVHENLSAKSVVVVPMVGKGVEKWWKQEELNDPGFIEDVSRRLGNLVLLSRESANEIQDASAATVREILQSAHFETTAIAGHLVEHQMWRRQEVDERQNKLAELAIRTWSWEELR